MIRSAYYIVETSYNMVFGIIGFLIMSIFGGGSLIWLICPTPYVICLPYYLRFSTLFVVFVGGCFGYEMAGFAFSDGLHSARLYGASSFAGSMWFLPFLSTCGVSFRPLEVGYRVTILKKLAFYRNIFRKIAQCQISWKSVHWEASCSVWRDRRREMTELIVAFRHFVKAPNNELIKNAEEWQK